MTNANFASMGRSTGGDTLRALIHVPKFSDSVDGVVPVAIVVPSGSPPRVNRWMSMVTGPELLHVMLRKPMPVSVPCAPTVTVCAILRPAPNGMLVVGAAVEPPCCSFGETRHV